MLLSNSVVIVSRAGKRVLIGNTDAEGRMIMTDLVSEARENILKMKGKDKVQRSIFTVATLTGYSYFYVRTCLFSSRSFFYFYG